MESFLFCRYSPSLCLVSSRLISWFRGFVNPILTNGRSIWAEYWSTERPLELHDNRVRRANIRI